MIKVRRIIILLSVVMLIGSIFVNKTYAAISCNVNISKPKEQVTYKEKFSVYVAISNLQTTKGIIAIGAVLSYDTNSLTLVDIEGENKWSDPIHNESNGKITSFKNKLSKNNENVFKITFEVNEKGKASNNAWIKINNFEISDGDEEKNCGGSSINIAIVEQGSNNSGDSNQGENVQDDNSNNSQAGNNSGGSDKGSTTTKKTNSESTTKKSSTSSKNKNDENIDKEEVLNNNEQTNIVENVITEEPINDNNIVQGNLEEDNRKQEETKKDNKRQFYTVSIVIIASIIVILLLLKKYWKTN